MKSIYDMKIGTRLLAAFIIVGAITAVIGYMGVASMGRLADAGDTAFERETLGIGYIKQASVDLVEVDRATKNVLLSSDANEAEQYKTAAEAYEGLVDEDLSKAAATVHSDKGKAFLEQAKQAWKESKETTDKVIALSIKEPFAKKLPSVELSMGIGRSKSDAAEDLFAQVSTEKEDTAKVHHTESDKSYHSSRTLLITLVLAGILLGVGFGVYISRSISKPLGLIAEAAKNIARGDVNQKIEYQAGDEVGSLADSFRAVIQAVNALTSDAIMLAEAAAQDKLDTRADVTKHQGDYRRVVEGFNGTLDVVVDKVNWYQAIIDAVPAPIHVIDKDMNWVFLNKAFEKLMVDNKIIRSRKDAPGMPCSSANANICKTQNCGIVQLGKGNGETYFDWNGQNCKQETSKLTNRKGEHIGFVEVVQDLTQIVRAKNYTNAEVVRVASNLVQIAKGDLQVNLKVAEADEFTREAKAQFEQINNSLVEVVNAVGALTTDSSALVAAAIEGKLATRADASKHQGDYRKIVQGVNDTLDAVIGPLNVAANYVDRIGKGDVPAKITDTYNGDFNILKNNLNACIDAINQQATAAQGIAAGDLSVAINVRCESDVVANSLVGITKVLLSLQTEMQRLTAASKDGLLSERGKPEQFKGAYAEIVGGINQMLDAILLPIGEGNRILALISNGRIDELIAQTYKGDHEKMKQAINNVGISLQSLVTDASMLAQAAASGRVGVRADASKHHGDYRKVVEGMNATLEAIVEPLKATAENASALATSSEELTAVSQGMASTAEETAVQANVVSAASEQVSRNVASVATASEEMQASIREIAKNANDSARVAKNAVVMAQSTNETMKKLGDSSQEIGNVIKVITSIAQQTNLLALNATIEAARAGEAGKGFAVVANEVKELAKQTAKATEEISQKIEGIQGVTKGAVTAIEEIGAIINQINDISNSIASAVEEQTVTTNEIGRSVTEAAQGVNDIAKNIGGVATAARNTTQGANDTKTASLELSEMAARLQAAVSRFTF